MAVAAWVAVYLIAGIFIGVYGIKSEVKQTGVGIRLVPYVFILFLFAVFGVPLTVFYMLREIGEQFVNSKYNVFVIKGDNDYE